MKSVFSFKSMTVALVAIFSLTAGAQVNQSVTTMPQSSSAPKTHSLVLSFKSTNDTGRPALLVNEGSRTAKSKNELQLGYKHSSGWGAYGNFVQSYESIRPTKNKTSRWTYSDPSLSLTHPDWYKNSDHVISGQLRYYFPTTISSEARNVRLYTYYLRSLSQLGQGNEIFNEVVPRYWQQSSYKSDDTTYYMEDTTIFTHRLNKEWKLGARQWTQYAVHPGESPGFSMELGPQAVYSFNSNFSITPSVMLPVLKQNKVYDGPTAVATDQVYMSLLLQAKL